MMKFIVTFLFMIPLCFTKNYWIIQFSFFILTFFCILEFSHSYLWVSLSYFLSMDLLSFTLILLSFWICALMILASEKLYRTYNYYNLFLFLMLMLMMSLFLTFSSMNLFIFYLFFEMSLIPTLMLIIGWGYQPERMEAGLYLLFYTLLVSLPMMLFIFYYYYSNGSLDFYLLNLKINNIYIYVSVNLVFLVKMPMFMLHLWLPKAHVEAPVSGSMILAGILLKLGGYGMMRLMVLFMGLGIKINYIIVVVSLLGGFIVSLICLRQSDVKSLIAYSSVAHMGMVLGGILTMNCWGMSGALIMMLAHGLCSSGLFCLANMNYERLSSRSLYLNKGFLSVAPSLSLWWFLFCSSNMAAPPSFNLLGEIFLMNSLISFSNVSMLFLMLMSFFSAVYSLFLYSYSQHGSMYMGIYSFYFSFVREFLLLILHWFPLNILVLSSDGFSLWF